jgi:L-type amino acid transporter 9
MGAPEKSQKSVGLQRHLGLMAAVNVILGVMIGSGIFISPTDALRYSGSVGACLCVWATCGVISLLGALCFAELGTIVPKSGAEYAYLMEAFGANHKFWGPLPSFVCAWIYVLFLRPAEIAVIVLTFGQYTIKPFHHLIHLDDMTEENQSNIIKLISILGLGLMTYINLVSVKLYIKINNLFSFCKVFACLLVIVMGAYYLATGHTENLTSGFKGTTSNFGFIALAFYNGLWAYDGWSSVTTITEEVKNPEKNIPRSIMIGVPIVTGLYTFMNVAYMTVMTKDEMLESTAVGLSFGERVLGPFAFIIPLGVALSTFSCAMSIQFGVTRLCYVAAREGHMLESLSYIHVKKGTPAPAVALQGILAFIFICVGNIATLIEFASFLIWFFYGMAMVALLVMRKTHAHLRRPYKVPIILPIVTLLVATFLVLVPIITDPSPKYFFAVIFIGIGVIVYFPFVYKKHRPAFIDKLTHIIQLGFQVAPTEELKDL